MSPCPKAAMRLPCPAVLMAAFAGEAAAPFDWGTATPESQGMSGAKRDAMRDNRSARGTRLSWRSPA